MKRSSFLALVLLGVCFFGCSPHAHAASQGIAVSPFQQTVTIQTTDTEKTFDITVTNNTPTVQDLSLRAVDFGSLNDTGGLVLEGSDSKYSQRYGLASWMTLGTDTVVLGAGETQTVPITITNRQTLQPGGHYGAVVVKVNSLDDQSGNKVVINQQVLSLVLVDKVGGEKYDLRLVGMTENGNWLHLPTKVQLRFQNPGNVHVLPRGTVELQSPSGTVLSKGIINSESAFVLPESFRTIPVSLTPVAKSFPLPGLYKIVVKYRYEGITASATKRYYIRFINLPAYLFVIVLAMGVVLYIRKRRTKKASK